MDCGFGHPACTMGAFASWCLFRRMTGRIIIWSEPENGAIDLVLCDGQQNVILKKYILAHISAGSGERRSDTDLQSFTMWTKPIEKVLPV